MYQLKHIFLFAVGQKRPWKRYALDTLLALAGSFVVTLLIYGLRLYPLIPNISLVYLVVVLALGSTRGLFAAVFAAVVAFLCFDFFLIEPLYMFTVTKPEEWLALFIFLCTAIITGQLT